MVNDGMALSLTLYERLGIPPPQALR